MALTYLNIEPTKGNSALLPNQPIIQGCKVNDSDLVAGDVVKLVSADNVIVVDKATETDLPFGVVVNNEIKTGWQKGERVSVFPIGSFVYLETESENVVAGAKVGVQADESIDVVITEGNAVLGIACSNPKNGLFIAQIRPEIYHNIETLISNVASKQDNLNLGSGLVFVDTDMYAWEGEVEGKEIVYTKSETPTATGNTVYYLLNGKYEILVDDATYSNNKLTITLAGTSYEYVRNSEADEQSEFLNVVE